MNISSKNIAFLGVFGSGNFGNDASFAAMLQFIRRARPDADLACVCTDPEKVERTYAIRTIQMSWSGFPALWFQLINRLLLKIPSRLFNFVRAIFYVRHFDLLIIPGTGIFDDFGEGPWGVPFGVFRWCLAAWICRTKVAIVSIGAGPIHHPISRWFMKSAMRMASYRSYRDTFSKDYMRSIGFDSDADSVYPDLAFGLETPAPRSAVNGEGLTVGVGIMTYYGWRNRAGEGGPVLETYLGKIETFILGLIERGHRVRLLIGDVNDVVARDTLLSRLHAARPDITSAQFCAPPVASLTDVMSIITPCDLVVATRFHNIVGALALGKPVVSIGYAKKNDMLLGAMGLADFCQHIETLDPALLEQQFAKLAAGREAYSDLVHERIGLLRAGLKRQETALIAAFLGGTAQATGTPEDAQLDMPGGQV
jgi:polysaccharide pyruvyl transferase WcaK-like protein